MQLNFRVFYKEQDQEKEKEQEQDRHGITARFEESKKPEFGCRQRTSILTGSCRKYRWKYRWSSLAVVEKSLNVAGARWQSSKIVGNVPIWYGSGSNGQEQSDGNIRQ